MTEDKGIFIRNVYYMLSYAFTDLKLSDYRNIAPEDFERMEDFLAEILFRGVSMRLKQGLHREYIDIRDDLTTMRGRLDIYGTMNSIIKRKKMLVCEYDELSGDILFNRILLSTMLLLIESKDVASKRKSRLCTLLPFFGHLNKTDLRSVAWERLTYRRDNESYRMLMNICRFIAEGQLLTTESGSVRMPTFSEKNMAKLFERFVLQYYRIHYRDLAPNPDKIRWDLQDPACTDGDSPAMNGHNQNIRTDESSKQLPDMRTDITLHAKDRILIIDTKYYGSMTQTNFDKESIHSSNLYQIYAYVKNMAAAKKRHNPSTEVSGMLLYARSSTSGVPDFDGTIDSNRFLVKTLNLNLPFSDICRQLNDIVTLWTGSESAGI